MLDSILPTFNDVDELTSLEQSMVMLVRNSTEAGVIERFIRRVFIYAIVSQSSDVHIEGRGDRNSPHIYVHVRTPKGMVNWAWNGEGARHFENKMFMLTGTPQGGSTGDAISTRFSMKIPAHYALKHGLSPKGSAPYAVNLRVEYAKTFDGFSFVSRLIDQQRAPSLDDLNLPAVLLHSIKTATEEPSGLILASGPTGSGKTTLLNAVLSYLNDGQRSIITIENPVEFVLEGNGPIKQMQVYGEFTFARALRSALRQDPDIILIGEIRDEETMDIALKASQTGHLVLSTVHANNSHETISRLLHLKADPFTVAENLKLVMAQRLLNRYEGEPVRRVLTRDERSWLSLNGLTNAETIDEVGSVTKVGKVSVIEAIVMDDQIKQQIRAGDTGATGLYRIACEQQQYESLACAGMRAVEACGARLKDCMVGLESNSDAHAHPGIRIRLAMECGLSLTQVANAIDSCWESWGGGGDEAVKRLLRNIQNTSHSPAPLIAETGLPDRRRTGVIMAEPRIHHRRRTDTQNVGVRV